MSWRGKRKIDVNKEEAKSLKKKLNKAKNTTEIKRINIMIVYLWWKNTSDTSKILWVSKYTTQKITDLYIEDKENFYKTNYKWKTETKERMKLKKEIKETVENKIENNEYLDINEVLRTINKKHNETVTNYHWMRWILRKWFWYNYQKPFVRNKKKSKYAKDIIKGRLTKAIIKVWIEENDIDAVAVKNKKTKFWEIIA